MTLYNFVKRRRVEGGKARGWNAPLFTVDRKFVPDTKAAEAISLVGVCRGTWVYERVRMACGQVDIIIKSECGPPVIATFSFVDHVYDRPSARGRIESMPDVDNEFGVFPQCAKPFKITFNAELPVILSFKPTSSADITDDLNTMFQNISPGILSLNEGAAVYQALSDPRPFPTTHLFQTEMIVSKSAPKNDRQIIGYRYQKSRLAWPTTVCCFRLRKSQPTTEKLITRINPVVGKAGAEQQVCQIFMTPTCNVAVFLFETAFIVVQPVVNEYDELQHLFAHPTVHTNRQLWRKNFSQRSHYHINPSGTKWAMYILYKDCILFSVFHIDSEGDKSEHRSLDISGEWDDVDWVQGTEDICAVLSRQVFVDDGNELVCETKEVYLSV